ncbi:MAG TPA: cell wall metabolism sensor histidine kinase WalK, partial [Firmicutes bacterium]|nr:cell wall metabolism sensor histidine kinase WalK [Bacillota bacterium]
MHSIKYRMLAYFLFIIIITVGILELFLISGISRNYYKSLEDSLRQQLQTAAELYTRYFADATLEENIINNVDLFWKQATARVEIIGMDGRVLLNSHGTVTGDAAPDVSAALAGREAVWTGRLGKERVMAASRPLLTGDTQAGVLRLVASLEEVHAEIQAVAVRYLSFGGLVILLTALVSILLANTITEPLKKVTLAAEEMAAGNFSAQSTYSSRDEIGKLSATLNYLAS